MATHKLHGVCEEVCMCVCTGGIFKFSQVYN